VKEKGVVGEESDAKYVHTCTYNVDTSNCRAVFDGGQGGLTPFPRKR